MADDSKLRRVVHPIPEFVIAALEQHGLMEAYEGRPAYQRNDYIGWITSAKRNETQQKRLAQMLEELKRGGVYMKMDHPPSRKS